MVRLINWRKASKAEKHNIKRLLKELSYYDVVIVPKTKGYIEYVKSTDIDTNERLIIRSEKKNKLHRELSKLHSEGFTVKVVLESYEEDKILA